MMRHFFFDRVTQHCESHWDEGVELMVCKAQVVWCTSLISALRIQGEMCLLSPKASQGCTGDPVL